MYFAKVGYGPGVRDRIFCSYKMLRDVILKGELPTYLRPAAVERPILESKLAIQWKCNTSSARKHVARTACHGRAAADWITDPADFLTFNEHRSRPG
jgi:hypothetical protein